MIRKRNHPTRILWALTVLASLAAAARAADGVTVEVDAGKHDRHATPVFFDLPKSLAAHTRFTLKRLDTGESLSVQLDATPRPRAVWMIGERLPAGGKRRYRLAPLTTRVKGEQAVTVTDDGKHLLASVSARKVLRYNHAVVPSPDPKQPYYRRSGYIHPVFNPSGEVVTDDFAPDHLHQHGIMFPWTSTTFQGRRIDFWNSKKREGTVEHVKTLACGGGAVFGHFTALLRHVDLKAPDGKRAVLNETWRVRVYNRADAFLFDIESVQACATAAPLKIDKYHYGGMAVRGSRQWLQRGKGDFLTSDGKTRKDGNHSRPRWVDIYGLLNGRATGLTVFGHTDNFRSPQPVRVHPNKPYFCFAPMVLGEFQIVPGKPYVSKYRCFVHHGKGDPAQAERLWNDYVHPVRVQPVERG